MSFLNTIPTLSFLCRRHSFVEAIRKGNTTELRRLVEEDPFLVNATFVDSSQLKLKESALHIACRSNKLEIAKVLLHLGADVEGTCNLTPLMVACERGLVPFVKLLLDNGSNVNARVKDYFLDWRTTLHLACSGEQVDIVKLLLDCKADLEARDYFERTPFLFASRHGRLEIMKHFANIGCDMKAIGSEKTNAFHFACLSGHLESVLWLTSCGFDITEKDTSKRTGLHLACQEGHLPVVKLLLGRGLHMELRDEDGSTPFLCAAKGGSLSLLKWLKGKGCNIGAKNWRSERNALHLACMGSNEEAAEYLIKHCSDFNEFQKEEKMSKRDSESFINLEDEIYDGKTALMLASQNGLLSIVKLLVARNRDWHRKDKDGKTALHHGCESGNVETVKFLLSCGLTIDEEDIDGETILHSAVEGNHSEVVELLLTKYWDVTQKGRESWERLLFLACKMRNSRTALLLINAFLMEITRNEVVDFKEDPLCEACKSGLFSVVECLAKKGWSVNRRDRREISPLAIACSNNHNDIVHFLIDFGVDLESKMKCMTIACSKGIFSVVLRLIENGCSPKERLEEGRSWLHSACVSGQPEMALFLIKAGVIIRDKDNDGMTLFLAACEGASESPDGDMKFVPVVECLLTKGCLLKSKDENQRSLLHIACEYRLVHIAHFLIDSGISLNEFDKNGQSPVMIACEKGLLSVVRLFSRKCLQNPLALFTLACRCECVDLMLLLLDFQTIFEQENCAFHLLWTACKKGHLSAVKHFAEKEDFLLKVFCEGNLLHVACEEKQVDVAIFLIERGVDVNRIDNARILLSYQLIKIAFAQDRQTPAEIACAKGLLPVVRALHSRGCSLKTRTKDGNNLLHIACSSRHVDVATFLIGAGIDLDERNHIGEIPLEIACRFALLAVVRADVEKACFLKENRKDANRQLRIALKKKKVMVGNVLIDAGVNILEKNDSGRTAIALACEAGIYCIVERLANLGSCLKNESLLHLACTNGHYHVVEFLIKSGVDVNERNSEGATPLMIACGRCYFAIARLLLDSGCCVNAKDSVGKTGVRYCCEGFLQFDHLTDGEFVSTMDPLIENGSDLNSVDQFGVTSFIYVMKRDPESLSSHDAIVSFVKAATKLVSAGAIIELKSEILKNGALHLLTRAYSYTRSQILMADIEQLAEDFLSHGANPVSQNREGKFPYELAKGQLRLMLRKAFQEKRFSELSLMGVVSPERIKVCLIGDPKAGKTTLLKSLRRSGISIMLLDSSKQSEPRTVGIDIVVVNMDGLGEWFFMDFAGQAHFHKTHSLFFSGSTTIYLLVMDLTKTDPELFKSASYWLSLVKCSVNPSGSRVVLIGSRGEILSDGALRKLRRLLNRKFHLAFLVCDEVFALDCRSHKMDELKTQLLKLKNSCIESADKVPEIVQKVTLNLLPQLRRFMQETEGRYSLDDLIRERLLRRIYGYPIKNILSDHKLSEGQVLSGNGSCFMSKDLFCLLIEQNVYLGLTGTTLSLLMQHLRGTGEIFEIEGRIILDPPWLCHDVIGPLLSPDDFPIHMEGVMDGRASDDQIMQVIKEFNPDCHFLFEDIILILSHMEICFPVFGENYIYQFPGLICEQRRQEMWLEDANKEVYVGRRIQCKDETDIIIPGAIPFLQTRSAVRLDPQLLIWKDGMIITTEKEDCTLQCLIELQERAKAIDIIARGPRYSEAECLKSVEDMTLKVLDDKSPGTVVLALYLSTSEIKKLADNPPAYDKHKVETSERSVSVKVGLEVFSDSVRELLVVQKDHYVFLPMTVKDGLVRTINRSEKADDLGRALRLSYVDIACCGNSSHDILTKWSENLNATVPDLVKGLKEANCRVGLRLLREAATGSNLEATASLCVPEPKTEDIETSYAGSSTAEDSDVIVEAINRPVFQSDVNNAIVGPIFNNCTINL